MSIDFKKRGTGEKDENRIYFKYDIQSEFSGLFIIFLLPSPHESLNRVGVTKKVGQTSVPAFPGSHGKIKSKNFRIRKKHQQ